MTPRSIALGLALALTVIAAPACGNDTASDEPTETTAAVTTTATASAELTIDGAWARNSPMEATNGAAYPEITGGSADDELTGASVDASIAAKAEVHETVMANEGMSGGEMGSTTMAPAMEMRPVDSVAIPAGKTVTFKPGGYHIMLLDLVKPLELGDTFDLTLTFAEAGDKTVTVEVKDAP